MGKGLNILLMMSVSVALTAQTLGGRVLDRSNSPVPGAMAFLSVDSTRFSLSDSLGYFRLQQVAEGRGILIIRRVGYASVAEEVLVTKGKSVFREIVLEESNTLLDQVGVIAGRPAMTPGSYGITIEKTLRMPANFFDPLRLAAVLPAVANGNDQANGISFRGYSPNAMLWRLEGMDIVNPNHLANAGTLSDRPVANGGGVSILSAQVLDRSEFHYGILPASAGNALSGMMDMTLRKGNTQPEFTVQAGVIGTDLAAEGKLDRTGRTTWLVNGRYSTVGLLSKAGVDFGGESIDFSDLTFHVRTDHQAGGGLSVFGFAGSSSNRFGSKPISEWETEKDRYNITFTGRTLGMGMKDTRVITRNITMEVGLTWSSQQQERNARSVPFPQPHVESERFSQERQLLSGVANFKARINKIFRAEAGAMVTLSSQKLLISTNPSWVLLDRLLSLYGRLNGALIQPYGSLQAVAGPVQINAGLRWMKFTWNNTYSLEPRVTATLNALGGQFTAGYGVTSQVQQAQVYLSGDPDLPMTRSAQWYGEYARSGINGLRWRVSAFHHRITRVPVRVNFLEDIIPPPISAINFLEETGVPAMVTNGTGRNVGLEGMVEKRFERQWYLLASGSLMDARYGLKGASVQSQSRFNSRYTWAMAGGKEWRRPKNAIGVHLKAIGFDGQRERAIIASSSSLLGTTVWDVSRDYVVKLPDYFRTDLRIAWRKDRPGRTRTISIDVQNILNIRNVGGHYFDTFLNKVTTRYQLGIIPVLTWRLDF